MEASLAPSTSNLSFCEHKEYQVYCPTRNMILCLDCALEDTNYKVKTLKVAASEQFQKFEEILQACKEH